MASSSSSRLLGNTLPVLLFAECFFLPCHGLIPLVHSRAIKKWRRYGYTHHKAINDMEWHAVGCPNAYYDVSPCAYHDVRLVQPLTVLQFKRRETCQGCDGHQPCPTQPLTPCAGKELHESFLTDLCCLSQCAILTHIRWALPC